MTSIDRPRIDYAALPRTLSPSDIAVLERFGVPASALTLKENTTMTKKTQYVACNRMLDPETNEHCEFVGDVEVQKDYETRRPLYRGLLRDRDDER